MIRENPSSVIAINGFIVIAKPNDAERNVVRVAILIETSADINEESNAADITKRIEQLREVSIGNCCAGASVVINHLISSR
jgi:hypothetical protein